MERYSIIYDKWNPKEQKLREALCTLGNGYFATRGAVEENDANEFNYPGTYLAGGYNRAKTDISGKIIENEDFVNFPNWLCLTFKPIGGEWLDLEVYNVLKYQQTLDLRNGLLIREFKIEDGEGRCTSIISRRLVSMRDKHIAAIEWIFKPDNWSGKTEIRTALDGTVKNAGVERYNKLESVHLAPKSTKQIDENSIQITVETKQSKIALSQAARTLIYENDKELNVERKLTQREKYIDQTLYLDVIEGEEYRIEKVISLYTSLDKAISEPSLDAANALKRIDNFKAILSRHKQSYDHLWRRADIGVINGDRNQQLIRLHIFHILQTVSLNTIGEDVGVPARGLHGEAYRGHIFWDELFILPYLNLRFPQISRSLLKYRYFRLDEARHAALEDGKKGAMYPWQSGSNGREETQTLHLNPQSGNWLPDNTHLQRHINSTIAYNIWNYYLATEDQQFLSFFGAEMFLSISSFWASMVVYNEDRKRYEIHNVVGPDEYHTDYPKSQEPGLNNNAYTNVMAAWVLQKAIEILKLIEKSRKRELLQELGIDEKELELWVDISKKMYVPFIDDNVIAQFEGYENLKEFPWQEYKDKYEDIHRLDRILESEGDSVNNYKASKQADVLMLFYLFSKTEINDIFQKLDYKFNENSIYKNIEYYRARTSHGSTLSRLVFSWILLKYDKEKSWDDFETVLLSDFEDVQGGTTAEGIHLGAMAGSLDIIQRGFLGLEVGEQALWINPDFPKNMQKISVQVLYRKHLIFISADHHNLKISFEEGWSNEVSIGVIDKIYQFKQGEVREFALAENK